MPGEWGDLLGIYTGFLQETTNNYGEFHNLNPVELSSEPCSQNVIASAENIPNFKRDLGGAVQSFNPDAGSYAHDYDNHNEVWKNNPLAELLEPRSTIPNKYMGIESNFIEVESANSIFGKQDCILGLNKRNNGFGCSQQHTGGFPVPFDSNYKLNSPPRSETDATSSTTNSFKFAPETPDQQKQSQNHRLSEILNFLVDDHSSQESSLREDLTIPIRNEDIENRCDELLQNIVDSSPAAVISTFAENKISDGNDNQGIDLGATPEQKPRKRKHRPKVIKEGKPKKTQKPSPSNINTPTHNSSVKRKYVRKAQQTSVVNEAKSCKKALNFELETGTSGGEKNQPKIKDFDLNLDYQDTELCDEGNGLSPETNFHTPTPVKGRQDTLNIIARNSNLKTKISLQAHCLNFPTAGNNWNQISTPPRKDAPASHSLQQIEIYSANKSAKKKTMEQSLFNQGGRYKVHQQQYEEVSGDYKVPSKNIRGMDEQKFQDFVDKITYRLKCLRIDGQANKIMGQPQHALVPYEGGGTIIPYEAFNPIIKRKLRPKVDLDQETERIWKQLMGIEGSEAMGATDEKKEKWWENEREVFRGRAESFIARMHLVQGDRRFSQWKGSVVDSVIGVFLTQNVSDHLSSSAFMSLAAKFPLGSTNTNQTCCQKGAVLVEEPDIQLLEQGCHIRDQEVIENLSRKTGGNEHYRSLGSTTPINLLHMSNGFYRSPGHEWSNRLGHIVESTSTPNPRYNGMISFQSPVVGPYQYLNMHPTHHLDLTLGPQTENYQHFATKHQLGSTFRQRDSIDLNFTGQSFTTERTNIKEQTNYPSKPRRGAETTMPKARKEKGEGEKGKSFDWDSLRKQAQSNGKRRERSQDAMDSLNYEALRCADVKEISEPIKERGMSNMLAERMKDFLNRLVREHGSIDLEWLRDVPPDKAKDYLLSVWGLGLKSVECVRLLTLHHLAFPVDTNVGRIAVRLGWVPLQPLPESLQLHLLELYPVLETIQKYLWPRLCKLEQRTLYELHYQMITFGKVFCTKSKPNCNACPMRGECRHFASAFTSARLALPGPEDRSIVRSVAPIAAEINPTFVTMHMPLPLEGNNPNKGGIIDRRYEPIVEEPSTPEAEKTEILESDIEDALDGDTDEIPMIKLDTEEFILNLHNYMQDNMELQEADMSKALVALNPQAASIPAPKLKNVNRLRTEHLVYQLPDTHPLLNGLDKREHDDPSPYLLAIWTPGETESTCQSSGSDKICINKTCFTCNSTKESDTQTVRGTLLIPCRTAMRGSFPLNGTYFQVNEMFADHKSSQNPIDVPTAWIWNLPRRTVYFGTSVSTIFKGLSTEGIQYCFWRGFVCVRGFEQKTRSPRPLTARLHSPPSKWVKTKK